MARTRHSHSLSRAPPPCLSYRVLLSLALRPAGSRRGCSRASPQYFRSFFGVAGYILAHKSAGCGQILNRYAAAGSGLKGRLSEHRCKAAGNQEEEVILD